MKQIPMTSLRQDWRTPKSLYETLDKEFHFIWDACPADRSPSYDGLKDSWHSPCFCNPPFKGIEKWVERGYFFSLEGNTVVFLIPSRTDTRWWHDYCLKASEIRFIKGRIKYEGAKHNAPFPSCVVIFQSQSVV